MNPLLLFIYRIGLWILHRAGLYVSFSRLVYRRLPRQRKYRGQVNPVYNFEDLRAFIRTKSWKKDTIYELGDAIAWPRYFEEAPDEEVTGRDCDEFAVWILDACRCGLDCSGDDRESNRGPVGSPDC